MYAETNLCRIPSDLRSNLFWETVSRDTVESNLMCEIHTQKKQLTLGLDSTSGFDELDASAGTRAALPL